MYSTTLTAPFSHLLYSNLSMTAKGDVMRAVSLSFTPGQGITTVRESKPTQMTRMKKRRNAWRNSIQVVTWSRAKPVQLNSSLSSSSSSSS
jgi:hypothetical protein